MNYQTTPRTFMLSLVAVSVLSACSGEVPSATSADANVQTVDSSLAHPIWPKLDITIKPDPAIEEQVEQILATMTTEQKLAQMIQPEIRDVTIEEMRQYGFGSFLNGGGSYPNANKQATPQEWIDLAEAMYQASVDDSLDGSSIPTMWGTDAVHGHNNVIGATLFPHNIGLGAANDPDLIERIAQVTATEVLVTGIDWIFAPTVATVRNDRWGRTYEGYSEHPDIVRAYSEAIVRGLQGVDERFMADGTVISTVKHFVGDGGTTDGVDQGNTIATDEELFTLHAQGYVGGLTAGSQSVMASFNRWNGKKIHGDQYLLTEVLKKRMGFDGFVVGDWNGHGQVAGCVNESCPQAINAGLDIFMAPTQSWKALWSNTLQQINDGVIPMTRVDDAVRRILRVKVRAGLFDKPSPAQRTFSGKTELLGAPEHRAVAREAVRKSLVMLKNQDNLVPLSPNQTILVAGDGADNIGKQSGGWTITWQGTNNQNSDFPGGTSIYGGIAEQVNAAGGEAILSVDGSFSEKPDVAVVVFGEEPYAEGVGDIANLEYSPNDKSDLALLRQLQAQGIPTVAVFITGRPLWVNAELNASDAFVAAWLPGSEGGGVADVLLRDSNDEIQYDMTGKLSFSWPRDPNQIVNIGDADYAPLFAYGFGLSYGDTDTLGDDLPETIARQVQDKDLVFYDRSTQAPWTKTLVAAFNSAPITASTQTIGVVNYRTLDREVQEDAFLIDTAGGKYAGVRFAGNGSVQDYSAAFTTPKALSVMVNVTTAPSDAVQLGLNCGSVSNCSNVVDIAPILASLPTQQWQTLRIDAACWQNTGIDFGKIAEGLSIITAGTMQVAFSDIAFVQSPESKRLDMTCANNQ